MRHKRTRACSVRRHSTVTHCARGAPHLPCRARARYRSRESFRSVRSRETARVTIEIHVAIINRFYLFFSFDHSAIRKTIIYGEALRLVDFFHRVAVKRRSLIGSLRKVKRRDRYRRLLKACEIGHVHLSSTNRRARGTLGRNTDGETDHVRHNDSS